jgi:hypothetical protein
MAPTPSRAGCAAAPPARRPAPLASRLTAAFAGFVLAVLAGVGLLAGAAPAQAATGYTFWGYYHLTGGGWTASMKGADGVVPPGGAVEGFRYATTTGSPDRPPRATPSFADICAGTTAAPGQKRVGVVLDYGTAQDAPDGQAPPRAEAACAVVPAGASAQQALESVRPLRIEDGLVCAVAGYPASGCAQEVSDPVLPRTEQQVDLRLPSEAVPQTAAGGVPWPLVGVGALVVALGGGAVALSRRRA